MPPFTPRDRLWLLALPVYVLLLVFLHEASHAVVAVTVDGAELTEMVILPRYSAEDGFVRAHVQTRGPMSGWTLAAPYLRGLLTFALLLPLCWKALHWRMPKGVWINLVVIGMAIPLMETVGNYGAGLLREGSDVGRLLSLFPLLLVHAVFLGVLAFYGLGLRQLLRRARGLQAEPGAA